jgi:molecular chaperone DnaK (HSP70)
MKEKLMKKFDELSLEWEKTFDEIQSLEKELDEEKHKPWIDDIEKSLIDMYCIELTEQIKAKNDKLSVLFGKQSMAAECLAMMG